MNADEIRFHLRNRGKAVREIEQQEVRALTLDQRQKLNALGRFALKSGMKT